MPIDRAQLAARLRAIDVGGREWCPRGHDCSCKPSAATCRALLSTAERDALLAALGAEAEPRGWQPFKSAPKDEWILACTDIYGIQKIAWVNSTWMTTAGVDLLEMGVRPTHWMRLPSPPSPGREEHK